MNYFFPEGWLTQEKLISASLIANLHNNRLNKTPRRASPRLYFVQG